MSFQLPVFPTPQDHKLPADIKLTPPPQLNDDALNRILGSLIGLAVGDALGASVEFRPHQYLLENPVSDMQSGGTWGLKAGQWTDDTSMALCLASSLITKNGFDPYNQMVHYKWWYKNGFLSSTGHCFDIGSATRQSLDEFAHRQKMLKSKFHCKSEFEVDQLQFDSVKREGFNVNCSSTGVAGNGALMRLAPVPLYYFRRPTEAVQYAGLSATLTHGDQRASDACRYYAALIVAAVNGVSKNEILSNEFLKHHSKNFGLSGLHEEVLKVAKGSYKKNGGYDGGIRGKGYIVNALEAALWAFWAHDTFQDGALAAVNLGDDTDTTAAIYGQLAGAYYGYQSIPKKWTHNLYAHQLLFDIGTWLHYLGSQVDYSRQQPPPLFEKNETSNKNRQTQPEQASFGTIVRDTFKRGAAAFGYKGYDSTIRSMPQTTVTKPTTQKKTSYTTDTVKKPRNNTTTRAVHTSNMLSPNQTTSSRTTAPPYLDDPSSAQNKTIMSQLHNDDMSISGTRTQPTLLRKTHSEKSDFYPIATTYRKQLKK